ncbi:MAG: hypothetical protein J7498_13275 [Sphingobium sp.]|nr:hypothetical protein [Sphingobium sp.]
MKLKVDFPVIGAAVFALLAPAAASAQGRFSIVIGSGGYGYPGYDGYRGQNWHRDLHEDLDDEHDDIHDELDEQHARAHEQWMTAREHRQLHRYLDREHERADHELRWEHAREHRRESWQIYNQYRPSYGYDGW